MGQKVSPVGLRVGVNRNWDSRWYANDQDFAGLLHEDIKVRDYILKKLKTASVAKVAPARRRDPPSARCPAAGGRGAPSAWGAPAHR